MKYPCCLIRRYSICSNTGTRVRQIEMLRQNISSVLQTFTLVCVGRCYYSVRGVNCKEFHSFNFFFSFSFFFYYEIFKVFINFFLSTQNTVILVNIVFLVSLISPSILLVFYRKVVTYLYILVRKQQ